MKKLLIFTAVFLMCGALVFSHQKGDLAVNVETPLGFAPGTSEINGVSVGVIGFEGGISTIANYYFFPWISLNAGLGFGGWIEGLGGSDTRHRVFSHKVDATNSVLYFSVPFGIRMNVRAFVMGGGLICYLPFYAKSEITETVEEERVLYYSSGGKAVYGRKKTSETSMTDDSFAFHPFTRAYIDIGLDWGGRPGRTRGFGMLARLYIPLSERIASSDEFFYETYVRANFSLVFNYSFAAASFPIGGKLKAGGW
ncbi:MAG: hypothetical protein LBS57_07420 [Treponema sp.]|jgi:hypothetical protein|nr:hypothetical protein [Treponema sp.]